LQRRVLFHQYLESLPIIIKSRMDRGSRGASSETHGMYASQYGI
jgi:hypothetical protein